MNSNALYSSVLCRRIELKSEVSKLFDPNYANENRRNSFAQKIRKKTLYSLLNNNFEINFEPIKKFTEILGLQNLNFIEYINYDFSKKFVDKSLVQTKIVKSKKKALTKPSSEILSLIEKNSFDNFNIVIHGSHADGEITNYSDVDVSIFLKSHLINSLEKFREIFRQIAVINRKISFYDPISHHKAFLNLECDLNCYPESFMPIKVLMEGLVPDNHVIRFNSKRNDLDLKLENFYSILNTIIKITNENQINNLFKVKQIISNYFMLIILEFEILFNKFLDKKNIFQNEINKYKTKKELGVFAEASRIRSLWPNLGLDLCGISDSFIRDILVSCETMSYNIQSENVQKKISDLYLVT